MGKTGAQVTFENKTKKNTLYVTFAFKYCWLVFIFLAPGWINQLKVQRCGCLFHCLSILLNFCKQTETD